MTPAARKGGIRTLRGDFSPPAGRPVDLVFRTVGERTTNLALELAIAHIRPQRVHVIEHIRPLSMAVDRMLALEHQASHVVYVDADCLILEDMRPFLDINDLAYIDSYVRDRFRGRIHCGVHITRTDLVRYMRQVDVTMAAESAPLGAVLRPEAFRRKIVWSWLQPDVQLRGFHILHDHFQNYPDIFAKYALREVRSRVEPARTLLETAMSSWGDGAEFTVARKAIHHTRSVLPPDLSPDQLTRYLAQLPSLSVQMVAEMDLPDRAPLTMTQIHQAISDDPAALGPWGARHKVFCLGLPGTGNRSLIAALHHLGFDLAHYPLGKSDMAAMRRGDGSFPTLKHYDGLAGIFALPCFPELDARYPGARFILTVRDKEGWLRAAERLWEIQWPPGAPPGERAAHNNAKQFFQRVVCRGNDFDRNRLSQVYDEQLTRVKAYFSRRPDDLLILDICAGDGWNKIAPFFGAPVPTHAFPDTHVIAEPFASTIPPWQRPSTAPAPNCS